MLHAISEIGIHEYSISIHSHQSILVCWITIVRQETVQKIIAQESGDSNLIISCADVRRLTLACNGILRVAT